jgi:prepilin-type N-terminal cleavage/methylation domain-containing protein
MISVTGRSKSGSSSVSHLKKRLRDGFTLIEIMVSVAILSVGLILVLQGMAKCVNILRISQDNLAATILAEDKITQVEIASKQKSSGASFGDTSGEEEYGSAVFRWEVRLSPYGEYENLNELLATVSWKDGRNNGSSSFNTYLTVFKQ